MDNHEVLVNVDKSEVKEIGHKWVTYKSWWGAYRTNKSDLALQQINDYTTNDLVIVGLLSYRNTLYYLVNTQKGTTMFCQ